MKVGRPLPLDPDEPENLARAGRELELKYLVVTSVDRDDLPDGGASHFARAVAALRRENPALVVEVLIPDFQGSERDLDAVAAAGPHVVSHNLETVERLQPVVRDKRASYRQSLSVLRYLKERHGVYTKSSLMLGLGETEAELLAAFEDLRRVGVDVLTLGQYLQPSPFHLRVERFLSPAEFAALQKRAEALGFLYVAAGPLVRSSYRAAEFFLRGLMRSAPHRSCGTASGWRPRALISPGDSRGFTGTRRLPAEPSTSLREVLRRRILPRMPGARSAAGRSSRWAPSSRARPELSSAPRASKLRPESRRSTCRGPPLRGSLSVSVNCLTSRQQVR